MNNTRTFLFIAGIATLGYFVVPAASSAIPMWEFLSRDEKMSHLFGVFSQQVARFCSDSSRPDCNKNFLVTGIRNLANMDDNRLDKLDPYQRDAREMIWRAMVGTSRYNSRVGQETEDDSYFTTGTDPLATSGSETNGLGEESASGNDYVRPSEHSGPYLVGPMVIRVFPDGRPVPEDSTRPLPRDEDAEELRYARVPSIEEIEASPGNSFYGKQAKESSKRGSLIAGKNRHRQPVPSVGESAVRHRNTPSAFDRRLLQEIIVNRRVPYY